MSIKKPASQLESNGFAFAHRRRKSLKFSGLKQTKHSVKEKACFAKEIIHAFANSSSEIFFALLGAIACGLGAIMLIVSAIVNLIFQGGYKKMSIAKQE